MSPKFANTVGVRAMTPSTGRYGLVKKLVLSTRFLIINSLQDIESVWAYSGSLFGMFDITNSTNELIALCGSSCAEDGKNNRIDVFLIPSAFPSSEEAFPGRINNGILRFFENAGTCDNIVGG